MNLPSAHRSVLIVAPHFAPETHAAVFRAHKLAKYLPGHGWKPYVLTVDTNYLYNEDPTLLGEMPGEVEIIRTRYIEPTMRGLRMALGGEDRTYAALKTTLRSAGAQETISSGPQSPSVGVKAAAGRAYAQLRNRWLNAPDPYRTWERTALREGRRLIAEHGIPVVFSTCMPFTTLRIGRSLQRQGVRWVADFRDPATYGHRFGSPPATVEELRRNIVRESLMHADAVTTTARSYGLIFHDLFGPVSHTPPIWIPTGVDDALLPRGGDSQPAAADEDPYVIFVGETMADAGMEFFDIFAAAVQRAVVPHRLLIVGHEGINRRHLGPVINRLDLCRRVTFIDHVPQRRLYQLIDGASACVLAPGRYAYWWNLHAKLVDYVGLRKPVIAVVPDPSEARSVLIRSRLGVFLDGDDDEAVSTLVRFLDGDLALPEPDVTECDRFLASSQVKTFVDLFESLLA